MNNNRIEQKGTAILTCEAQAVLLGGRILFSRSANLHFEQVSSADDQRAKEQAAKRYLEQNK